MSGEGITRSVRFGMDTAITHAVYGGRAEEALAAAEKETARLERLLSRYLPGSDIDRVNRQAGLEPVRVGPEAMAVLQRAAALSRLSRGAFDITVGPLVDIWRAAKKNGAPPEPPEIQNALRLIDNGGPLLDPGRMTAALRRAGQSLDPGGIAKGYAADRILGIFRQYGAASAYTDFGGNIAALGCKPDGTPWLVGIRHPRRENALIGAVAVIGGSVVTSGDYQRFFSGPDGRRYHHILDTETGYPADKGLVSVTVISDDSMTADALSTAVFALGLERGCALLGEFPEEAAVLVDEALTVHITPGLEEKFHNTGGSPVKLLRRKQNENSRHLLFADRQQRQAGPAHRLGAFRRVY